MSYQQYVPMIDLLYQSYLGIKLFNSELTVTMLSALSLSTLIHNFQTIDREKERDVVILNHVNRVCDIWIEKNILSV